MKNIIAFLFLFISLHTFSQMFVTDVASNQTLASQLASSTEQLRQLEKNYELVKSAEEKYQKINSIVTSVYKIADIIKLQKEAINNVTLVLNNTKLTGDSKTRLMKVLNNTIVNITGRVETVSNVMKDGFFSMNDRERIDMFQKERSAILALVSKTRGYANPYRTRN